MNWRALGVGRIAPTLQGVTLDGSPWTLQIDAQTKAVVLAFTSSTCPVSRKYAPTLGRMEAAYRDRGVKFIYVNACAEDEPEDIKTQIAEHDLQGVYLLDRTRRLAAALSARTTAEVYVIDGARTIVYRGAVDDQYGLGTALDAPRNRWLLDALDSTLAGRVPVIRATTVTGCAIDSPDSDTDLAAPTTAGTPTITWHNRISRIIADHCMECHRRGGVAPFPLETSAQVRSRSSMIRYAVEQGLMPPWFAAQDDASGSHARWLNDRSLPAADRDALLGWLGSSDKPEGEATDAPLPRVYPNEWTISNDSGDGPDMVLSIPEPIAVKADGVMPYVHVRVETGLADDRWVRAIEVLPTAREVVHHVLVFAVPRDADARAAREMIDETRGFFAAYVPGNSAAVFPEGFARLLPANSSLIFQLHYTPNGRATADQTRIGLVFADAPPRRAMQVAGVADRQLNIPPNSAAHREGASIQVPWDVRLVAFMPHMHVRGKAFRYRVIEPDGTERIVLDVPRYDFNWQLRYELTEPLLVSAGSRIEVDAWYDNSRDNPANPDPDARVRWGPQTTDEMLIGYIEYYVEDEQPGSRRDLARTDRFAQLLRLLDRNGDRIITRDEVPPRLMRQFESLDRDGDGRLTEDEVP